jgi:restriction endonuclease S subunit
MRVNIINIADVRIGYQFRKKLEPVEDGTCRVIQIRDFNEDRELNSTGLLRVNIDKAGPFLVTRGDVLFLSRGHKNWAAAIDADLQNTVAVSHFFVLKTRNAGVLPEYLAWYINQASAQQYLHVNARQGTHMPLVPMSAFKGLTIEIPSLETQRKIVELSKLMEKEKKVLAELEAKRSRLISELCLKAAKEKKEKAR